MPHIKIEDHLPGVTGLLEYRRDTSEPLRELTQILLRGKSTLTEAERELIATAVSHKNDCEYCMTSHKAAADAYLGEHETSEKVMHDVDAAPISSKMKALLTIALQVRESGKSVTQQAIDKAKEAGATDLELHDTVMIAALFCFYNRYVDGLGTFAPKDPVYYREMAQRLKDNGYHRPQKGYAHMKKNNLR
jgi:uncharacterized peroxidase-related enzyme